MLILKIFFLILQKLCLVLVCSSLFTFPPEKKIDPEPRVERAMKHLPKNPVVHINESRRYHEDVLSIATAFTDVIDVFLVKQDIRFNIRFVACKSFLPYDIIDDVGSKLTGNYETTIFYEGIDYSESTSSSASWKLVHYFSKSEITFGYVHYQSQQNVVPHSKLKFINFFSSEEMYKIQKLEKNKNSRKNYLHNRYFVVNFPDKVVLMTYDRWTEKVCNNFTLTTVNSFDKSTRKWQKPLENYEKLKNLHGCKLEVREKLLTMVCSVNNYESSCF